ncbi:hypothetical protein [Clostridium estertheticum]|uniref:hypothetical protein n=1 Tax=Clostridium estertheticum TaxID=238834 RepID=UPI001C0A9D81|nr:hypothetical protein [Clostridium estertheticum]MBU3186549.1 hypothetical protein [Clostridium estertheticum]
MEQTKGYFKAKGHIWNLDNKEAYTNSAVRSLSFGIQTDKDNTIFVQVGEWKNTTMRVKIKGAGMTEVEEINEQDSIDKIKELFKDGDSVFLNLRVEADTYNNKLKYLVNQIYVENEPIDFESKDFVETNELNTPVVIIAPVNDKKITVGMVNYKQELLEVELSLSDSDVKTYFTETVKVGDLVKVAIQVNRRPNYIEVEEPEIVEEPKVDETRKTLKGKIIGGEDSKKNSKKKRKIDGYIESLEIVDVDTVKTEKGKYTAEEIGGASEEPEEISEEDIPF